MEFEPIENKRHLVFIHASGLVYRASSKLRGAAFDRRRHPVACGRHAIATIASGDRTAKLRQLDVPARVIHGLADRRCGVSGGRAAAEAIPGAELILIEGLRHNLPPGSPATRGSHLSFCAAGRCRFLAMLVLPLHLC